MCRITKAEPTKDNGVEDQNLYNSAEVTELAYRDSETGNTFVAPKTTPTFEDAKTTAAPDMCRLPCRLTSSR